MRLARLKGGSESPRRQLPLVGPRPAGRWLIERHDHGWPPDHWITFHSCATRQERNELFFAFSRVVKNGNLGMMLRTIDPTDH